MTYLKKKSWSVDDTFWSILWKIQSEFLWKKQENEQLFSSVKMLLVRLGS